MSLAGKKILIGVCGGIAAYKIPLLVRLLKKNKAEVRVVMTASAIEFVSPLTLSVLSESKVLYEFQDEKHQWNNHVELGLWADVFLVAPATAKTISAMAHGYADNLLLTTYLSARCPVFVAPAMDLDMYSHLSTKKNLEKLAQFGNHIIESTEGELASGLVGKGRMEEPEKIFLSLQKFFENKERLKGKKILVTAGPTHEKIDPVRFFGNHSTGKMGYAIAKVAADNGAEVKLISGPVHLKLEHKNIEIISVESALQMYDEVERNFDSCDVAIMTAAVADYRPEQVAAQKIKKEDELLNLKLIKNPDILKEMGKRKKHQLLIGFALETQNAVENAQKKLTKKNADLIVLNSLENQGAGFAHATNQVDFVTPDGVQHFDLKLKSEVAEDIINFIIESM